MPDLTRFDFNVYNFMNSEDVENMTAEEVGQYCLLLFKSWMMAKNVTLPADPEKLAKIARVEKVSPLVMKKFRLVDTDDGQRYQNEVLAKEWTKASERSDLGRKLANMRWESETDADAMPTHMRTHSNVGCPSQAKPIQANPNQTNQSNPTVERLVKIWQTSAGKTCLRPNVVHKQVVNIWQEIKGPSAVVRYPKDYGQKYEELCENSDADLILAAFALWASETSHSGQFPASAFAKEAQQFMERISPLKEGVGMSPDPKRQSDIENSIRLSDEAFAKEREEVLKQRAEREALAEKFAQNPFGE